MRKIELYNGVEQGTIRPPSEAESLPIRITRNFPWNRCTFCSVYKNSTFRFRPVDHVLKDIDMVKKCVYVVLKPKEAGTSAGEAINANRITDLNAQRVAFHFVAGGHQITGAQPLETFRKTKKQLHING